MDAGAIRGDQRPDVRPANARPPPEGLILHTAGQGPNGWRGVDVWESREHFERFMEDQVMPAAEAMAAPTMSEPEIWELHNVLRGERTAV